MKKTAVMTDTNSGITPQMATENGIFLLKMPFTVDDAEYTEYVDMPYEEFFVRLDSGASVSTSQPSPAALTDMWDEILREYESLVYIPMSSGLSGTCATAKALSAEYDGRVLVADNRRISVTLYSDVFKALRLATDGLSAAEITARLEAEADMQSIYVAVNTLEHLKKSGRVTAAGAAVGTLLGIKPVLQIQGGKLDAYKKVRGMQNAVSAMLDGIESDLKTKFSGKNTEIRTAYSGDRSAGEVFLNAAAERFPEHKIGLDALPISISCHVGAGALGIGISVI